jgi:hypothetical protein
MYLPYSLFSRCPYEEIPPNTPPAAPANHFFLNEKTSLMAFAREKKRS